MAIVRKFQFLDSTTGEWKEQTSNDTIEVANGVNPLEAVNKSQLDGVSSVATAAIDAEAARAQAAEAQLTADLATERSERIAGDNTLTSNLNSEISRATGAEAGLAADIATEAATRAQAITDLESALSADILAEQTRAEGVEAGLRADLNTEISDRTAAVLAEKTRAEGVEANLLSAINAETSRAQGAEATLTSNLATEVSDRIAAVSAEASARAAGDLAEQTRAVGVENDLQAQISAEVTARETAINSLSATFTADLATETQARIAGDAALQTALDTEISDRQAAVSAEASARVAADTLLQANIDAEVARATAAESALSASLAQEVSDRQYAVSNEADLRIAGDAANLASINAEISARTQADADEVAARSAADSLLQTHIDDEAAARIAGDASTLADAKAYADQIVQAISFKTSVRVALPTSFEMGGDIISLPADFMSVKGQMGVDAGDRVLLIQPDGDPSSMDAGIYVVNPAGDALVRAPDMAVGSDASGAYVYVEEGVLGTALPAVSPGTSFVCSNFKGDDVVGTDALSFEVFQRAENLNFVDGLQKIGLDVKMKFKAGGPFTQSADGLEMGVDGTHIVVNDGKVSLTGSLIAGTASVIDSFHGHSRTSQVRAATSCDAGKPANYAGEAASWNASGFMGFVESKDGSNSAVIVLSGHTSHSGLGTAISTFNVGDALYLGDVTGPLFVSYADVPSGKWAVPVGFKSADGEIEIVKGRALLKA